MNTPLTLTCTDCGGEGQVYRSKFGGNDPDGWLVRCAYCDGQGTVTPRCDGRGCHTVASETIRWPTGEVEHYCVRCAEQARVDALMPGDVCGTGHDGGLPMTMNEDVNGGAYQTPETLTDWCRAHVQPPPARLLHAAANAVDRLRGCHGQGTGRRHEARTPGPIPLQAR